MSSPRSRSKTNGAFGNRKPRPIERSFSTPSPAQKEKVAEKDNIAKQFLNFAQPILNDAGRDPMLQKGALHIALLVWNADARGVDEIKSYLLEHVFKGDKDSCEEMFTSYYERKKELYPEDKSYLELKLLNYKHKTGWLFNVRQIQIAEGLSKTDLKDIIKPA